jgi:fatty-acyl-CoA synthase
MIFSPAGTIFEMAKLLRPVGKTLAAVLEEKALLSPGHAAIIYGEETVSYGELLQRTVLAAKALLAAGIAPGSTVGVLMGNEPDWVVLALAASMVGAQFAPLNTWYKTTELGWTLRHCGVTLLIAARRFLKTDYGQIFTDLIPELCYSPPGALCSAVLPQLRDLVMTGEPIPGSTPWTAFLKRGEDLSPGELSAVRRLVDPERAAFVLYTSGSTADPKGVVLNHRGVVENGFDLGQRRNIHAQDRVWLGTPLFYALGATNALPATLTAGATLVLQGAFEAGAAIATIQRAQATVYYGTGNMTRALLDHEDYDHSKIGSLKKGNAGIVAEYKRMTLVEMGISQAVPAYGLTETYGNATVGDVDDPLEIKLRTNGRPLPGMEMIIVDPVNGGQLSTGQTGLVLVRGHTTPGYLHNPIESAKVLRPGGFFDTGDLGYLDTDGRFVFHARLKEVIKSGGINISPVEIEQLIAAHPEVRDAYVVGVDHPVQGELIVAFVDRVSTVSESQLKAYVKDRAASFKTPHHIFFRQEDQLPRLASGKVAKHRLALEARQELGL